MKTNTRINDALLSGNYLEAMNKAKDMKLEDLSGCLASSLLSHLLRHIDGAYKSALFHSRRALELSPNIISLKENLLFFHTVPDRLICKEEAILLAKEVL
ncbi:hypothetical protein BLGI_2241 [Brevibacillus laterosporus GI-9]|uniref:hypothetical protein n=2 Tax=Brevibacillus TaxID=55080 RepID=UPI0002403B48|nr:hypothetical protein [Brevibacillus laterosporus]CCF14315.1 hypothetical protein BLGI_2241 [Brevibacillus laterosporus GI-9]